ncbi:unnamed protein product [Mesocestoides corti]|uniref:TGF_BETA_2 domain-containing protein n=1 Tax=Mesocestoides corti TaxID=53468 RepID=A0A158QUK8_MESCO|nr:unnamed protein product [Mesocestoides corti]
MMRQLSTVVFSLIVLANCSPSPAAYRTAPTTTVIRREALYNDDEAGSVEVLRKEDDKPQLEFVNPLQRNQLEESAEELMEIRRRKREREEEQEEQRFRREVQIEKFKQTLLRRLHLTEPPDLSHHGSVSNRTVANRFLRSLPLALQGRLLNQIRADDGAVEPPADRTDERETLILLRSLQWKLPKVSSATFAVELADEIDPSRIQSALLQFETSDPLLKGERLEVWEVFLTSQDVGEQNYHSSNRFNNLTWLFEKHRNQHPSYTSIPAPTVIRSSSLSSDRTEPEVYRTDAIRIRPGRVAEAIVPNFPGLVQVTLEISGTFFQWMYHKKRQPLMQKVVRTLLVVCPRCDSQVDPVDVKKGILEIRHRNSIRRTRRSLEPNHGQTITIGNKCSPKGHKFSCCTQSFSLNFEDVGWHNWILHPKTVEPNYCHGSCQADGIQKTPHSDLMHIYRSQNYDQLSEVQREAMLSCCHPIKMASMSVLYVDQNNELRMNTLHNIIVLECGCS